jgi:hypothetical protein
MVPVQLVDAGPDPLFHEGHLRRFFSLK